MEIFNNEKFKNRYEIKDGQIYSVTHFHSLHVYTNSIQGPYCSLWDGKKVTRIYLKYLFPKQFAGGDC